MVRLKLILIKEMVNQDMAIFFLQTLKYLDHYYILFINEQKYENKIFK